jgi:hypothetical protein
MIAIQCIVKHQLIRHLRICISNSLQICRAVSRLADGSTILHILLVRLSSCETAIRQYSGLHHRRTVCYQLTAEHKCASTIHRFGTFSVKLQCYARLHLSAELQSVAAPQHPIVYAKPPILRPHTYSVSLMLLYFLLQLFGIANGR